MTEKGVLISQLYTGSQWKLQKDQRILMFDLARANRRIRTSVMFFCNLCHTHSNRRDRKGKSPTTHWPFNMIFPRNTNASSGIRILSEYVSTAVQKGDFRSCCNTWYNVKLASSGTDSKVAKIAQCSTWAAKLTQDPGKMLWQLACAELHFPKATLISAPS